VWEGIKLLPSVIPIHGLIEDVSRNVKNKDRTLSTTIFLVGYLMILSSSGLCSLNDRIVTNIEQLNYRVIIVNTIQWDPICVYLLPLYVSVS
jgi:predicted metal-binding membrane protein